MSPIADANGTRRRSGDPLNEHEIRFLGAGRIPLPDRQITTRCIAARWTEFDSWCCDRVGRQGLVDRFGQFIPADWLWDEATSAEVVDGPDLAIEALS